MQTFPKASFLNLGFDTGRHVAILFDDCRVDRILENREFFQSSVPSQRLSQSFCIQGSYELLGYQTAMIVCTNHLPMTEQEGLSKCDAEWMQWNVAKVSLEQDMTWYYKTEEQPAQ